MCFSIADVRFLVLTPELKQTENIISRMPMFQYFSQDTYTVSGADITIRLCGSPPRRALNRMTLFESQQAQWLVARDQERYYFALRSSHQQASWLAESRADFTEAIVYCDRPANLGAPPAGTTFDEVSDRLYHLMLKHFLAQREGALFHAAAIEIDGTGFLFPGKSGAGKSTLIRQFIKQQVGRPLGDEHIAVRKRQSGFNLFGTPWVGEAGIADPLGSSLGAIFFITHAHTTTITPISRSQAVEKLIPTMSVPWYDPSAVTLLLTFCDELLANIPTYELRCTPTTDVVDVMECYVAQL